ncbi:hypothetical protein SAMN05216236_108123 [Sedimentitalea nanhaiensis]|uniref:Uncharacterized protein n=1 Tax=Sedimentitalea nanhaiensis TaxID=999627 RepID=A0A1I7B3L9_9RHOB|nr:hypothetical protein SAMN05216236_108123 [Sedimentitalea nanhaiensis]
MICRETVKLGILISCICVALALPDTQERQALLSTGFSGPPAVKTQKIEPRRVM